MNEGFALGDCVSKLQFGVHLAIHKATQVSDLKWRASRLERLSRLAEHLENVRERWRAGGSGV